MGNIRTIAAALTLLLNVGLVAAANAQDSTLIGMDIPNANGPLNLVTVQTATGQLTTVGTLLPNTTNVGITSNSSGYDSLTNTFSFEYTPSFNNPIQPEQLMTVNATTGQIISNIPFGSADSQPAFLLTPLAPNLGNFTTVNASTSVTTPVITATTGNIQTVNVGTALNVASGATVNMGGNPIQDVGAPVAPTDAATKGYVDASIGGLADTFNSGLNQAFKKIDQNSQGIAIAMAMSGLSLSSDKNAVVGGNVGFYDGKQAVAFQGAIRVTHNVTFNGGIGFGLDDNSPVGARLGFQVEF
jgi:hypothetical protein